MTSSYYCKLLK